MTHRFKKRERTQNWSPEEKILLLKLCEDKLDVLESKRGDQISIAKKANAWREIRSEFVSTLGIERDMSRLKEQWQRMKCQARSDLQDFAMRMKKYGAEVANQKRPSQMSAEVWRVMESARKYFIHMYGTESEEDVSTKEINWSLSEANIDSSSPSECDTVPSLLCETEVKSNSNDSDCMLTNENVLQQAKLDYFAKRNFVMTALTSSQQNSADVKIENNFDQSIDAEIQNSLVAYFEGKKLEQKKRLLLVDEQMKTAKLNRETAEIQKQIAQQQLKYTLLKASKDKERRIGTMLSPSEYFGRNIIDFCDEGSRKKLKEDLNEKLLFHEEQIRCHQDAISRHKQRLFEIDNE